MTDTLGPTAIDAKGRFDPRRHICLMLLGQAFDALDNEPTLRGVAAELSAKIAALSVALADLAEADLAHPSGREIAERRAAARLVHFDTQPWFER